MKKLILLLMALAAPSFAGQQYSFDDPKLNAEWTNNYKEHSYPNWVNAKGSSTTITWLNVSSGTASGFAITNSTITNLIVTTSVSGISGRIIQAVQTTGTTSNSSTSSSYVSSVVAGSITPKKSTSQIRVTVSTSIRTATAALNRFEWRLDRAGSALPTLGEAGNTGTPQTEFPFSFVYLDSPATTSATTYTLQLKLNGGTGGYDINVNGFTWVILLEELTS